MVRGFVYSFLAVSLFLLGSIGWMSIRSTSEETLYLMSGWLLLVCFFAVGPLFFAFGYWHHLRRNPEAPRWDRELGE